MRLYGDIEQRLLAYGSFTDGCWLWGGARSPEGYGRVRIGGITRYVHRALLEWKLGRALKKSEHTDHLCRVRLCFRPSHLEVVTPRENVLRGLATKLNDDQVENIRFLRKQGTLLKSLAATFGVGASYLSRITRETRRKRVAVGDLFDG